MPLKPDYEMPTGVDINDLLRRGAKQILKEAKEKERERANRPHSWEEHDTICVVQTTVDAQPTYKWEPQGSLPFDIPWFGVRASFGEAIKNKQSIDELLRRRLRRGYRERLLAAQVMPEADALARAMRLQIHIVEA